MERIGHLDGARHHGGEDQPIGARQIQGGVANLLPPLRALGLEPRRRPLAAATRDDVEELAQADVDDLGGELLSAPGPHPHEEHLVEAERLNGAKARRIVVDQGAPIGDDGVIDRMPVTAELGGDLVDAAGVASDLFGDPATGPVAHGHAGGTDAFVLFGPRPHRTRRLGAAPAALVPEG